MILKMVRRKCCDRCNKSIVLQLSISLMLFIVSFTCFCNRLICWKVVQQPNKNCRKEKQFSISKLSNTIVISSMKSRPCVIFMHSKAGNLVDALAVIEWKLVMPLTLKWMLCVSYGVWLPIGITGSCNLGLGVCGLWCWFQDVGICFHIILAHIRKML